MYFMISVPAAKLTAAKTCLFLFFLPLSAALCPQKKNTCIKSRTAICRTMRTTVPASGILTISARPVMRIWLTKYNAHQTLRLSVRCGLVSKKCSIYLPLPRLLTRQIQTNISSILNIDDPPASRIIHIVFQEIGIFFPCKYQFFPA